MSGYICEEHNNPPDFFLDVINGDSTAVSSTAAIAVRPASKIVHVTEDGDVSNGLLKSEDTATDGKCQL